MIDRILALPWGWAFLFLWVSVMGRANGTYWIGRAVAAGTGRTRWAGVLTSAAYARAQHLAERWGVLAVPLSFLTVGTQSLVQLSAGVSRMPLRLYLPAVSVGCAIWAAIYSTVGLAVFGRAHHLATTTFRLLASVQPRARVRTWGLHTGRRTCTLDARPGPRSVSRC